MNFIKKFFSPEKNSYIGLSSFRNNEDKKPEIKKEIANGTNKTTLTGIIKRAY